MSTDIHALAGAYVLDALSDTERAEFARHAAACPSCAAEVAELAGTVTRLADLTRTAPPARLRQRVLAQAGRTRQAGPGRVPAAAPARWHRWAAGVAAAVVVAAGAGTGGFVLGDRHGAQAPVRAGEGDRVLAVLGAADARVTTREVAGGGRVTVVLSDTMDAGVASVAALPAAPGRAYQLWLIRGSTPSPAGLLGTGVTGAVRLFTGVRGADAFGVSLEPPGGSAQPSRPLVTSFPLG